MRFDVKIQLDAIRRIRSWLSQHPSPDPVTQARTADLNTFGDKGEALLIQQRDGLLAVTQAVAEKEEYRRAIHVELKDLAGIARAAAGSAVGVDVRLRLPRVGASEPIFVSGARQVIAAAEANRALLEAHGLGPDQLATIEALLDRFEEAQHRANTGRGDHVGATAQLKVVVRQAMRAVRHINTLERRRLRGDADLLAAWDSARNIHYPARPEPEAKEKGSAA